ncbi:PTS transporter subunit EIIC [Spiroplasma sp. DGKH1]|uniref:PTS transporter subunit EIIC n=1 Tax=Spiroplasma sp. DGKH1 TaxID=3050074 RepID=UPI0034C62D8A
MRNKKPRTDNKFFGFMQQLGGTFMLPIAVLSVAGIFLGVGSAFGSDDFLKMCNVAVNSGSWKGLKGFFGFIELIGSFFFDILPLAFCMAIPIGLASDNKGTAAFSAFLAYVATEATINWFLGVLPPEFSDWILNSGGIKASDIKIVKNVFGYPNGMDLNVLGAMIIGIIVWKMHERFQYQKLPSGIAFFSGKRFTPVLCLFVFTAFGLVLTIIWPFICKGLYYFGRALKHLGVFGPGIFILISRLLCPAGLHHMINSMFNYTAVGGTYDLQLLDGTIKTVSGNYYAMKESLANGIPLSPDIAKWLTGSYILPIAFGLPAAGIAMYVTAKPERKAFVKGVIISGIVATAVGGITETIEFLFLFICPWLYIFHAFMVAVGYVVWGAIGASVGVGGDLISFIVYGPLQGIGTKWWLVFPCGVVDAAIYFAVFYFAIKKFNIKTIGREDETQSTKMGAILDTGAKDTNSKKRDKATNSPNYLMAQKILKLLGGWANIAKLENCFSRLRITLKNPLEISDADVKAVGAVGVKTISPTSHQIIVGIQVEDVKQQMIKMKSES